jgi:tRNA(Ile)-lysidine synthase
LNFVGDRVRFVAEKVRKTAGTGGLGQLVGDLEKMPSSVGDTEKKVLETIRKYGLITRGDGVVVAVSGGPDSICLLHILYVLRKTLGVDLFVAHFDHGLRPGEDEAETAFVESMAESMGLSFATREGRVNPGKSLEERARTQRYAFLEEVRERFAARKIALGHQRNDQAETVLMRLLRGSGVAGLSGIRPIRDATFIRPLLELRRSEIETYILKRELPFKTDPTNLESRFLRNRVRLELLPKLREFQPRVVDILALTADRLRADHEYLEGIAKAWVKKEATFPSDDQVAIAVPLFRKLENAIRNRVIRHCVNAAGGNPDGLTQRQINAVERLAMGRRPQAEAHLPKGLTVRRTYDHMVFGRSPQVDPSDYSCVLKGPGRFFIQGLGCSVIVERLPDEKTIIREHAPWTACFDEGEITFPLILRSFRPGDRFVPLGMTGHKKLKDFFVDLKIPSRMRHRTPILACGNRIVWVCGLRMDERFKVSEKTREILKITFPEGSSLHP